jgi:hypothetical protein
MIETSVYQKVVTAETEDEPAYLECGHWYFKKAEVGDVVVCDDCGLSWPNWEHYVDEHGYA